MPTCVFFYFTITTKIVIHNQPLVSQYLSSLGSNSWNMNHEKPSKLCLQTEKGQKINHNIYCIPVRRRFVCWNKLFADWRPEKKFALSKKMHELWRAGILILMTSHQGIVHNISMDKNEDLRQDIPVRLIHSFVTVNCTYFESARVSFLALGLRVTCSPGCFLCLRPEKIKYKFKKRL